MKTPGTFLKVVLFAAIGLGSCGALLAQRTVSIGVNLLAGDDVAGATIMMAAQGDENALGFTLTFDPAQLRFSAANSTADTSAATLHVNTQQVANGRLAVLLAMPPGWSLPAGNRALVVLKFTRIGASAASTALNFADAPVAREVSDVQAQPLAAEFVGTSVTLPSESSAGPGGAGN